MQNFKIPLGFYKNNHGSGNLLMSKKFIPLASLYLGPCHITYSNTANHLLKNKSNADNRPLAAKMI